MEHQKNLTPLMVETAERLQNARMRSDRRLVTYLTGIKAALADLKEHHAEEERAREMDRLLAEGEEEAAKRRAETAAAQRATADAFNGEDWMGQGEKQ